jgi:predicted DNA-binding protein with PD1-like motif
MKDVFEAKGFEKVIVFRIGPGEDILAAMQSRVDALGIHNAVILTGIGSARKYRFHVVASRGVPCTEAFPEGSEPLDITALTGYIMGGRIHAHITFSNQHVCFGGHLEPGSESLTFVIITLGLLPSELDVTGLDRLEPRSFDDLP